ncbi:MAG: class I SAM-dependent methyltransferase [Pseudomonadota bacterium]
MTEIADEEKPDGVTQPGAFWDQKYRGTDFFYGVQPNKFLVDQAYRLDPGARVLCLGDGEGRNGIWLAEQGFSVTSVDASPRALQKCVDLAMQRGVFLRTECADLREWDWPVDRFDAVVSIYLHLLPDQRSDIHRRALEALTPGGHFILEAFHKSQLGNTSGGPKNIELLYLADDLAADFAGADVILLEEAGTILDEGPGHSGPAAVSRLIARKPDAL